MKLKVKKADGEKDFWEGQGLEEVDAHQWLQDGNVSWSCHHSQNRRGNIWKDS